MYFFYIIIVCADTNVKLISQSMHIEMRILLCYCNSRENYYYTEMGIWHIQLEL